MGMTDEEYILAVRESDMAQLKEVEKYAQWLYDAHFCNGETQVTQYNDSRMLCRFLERDGVRVKVWSMLENESPNFLDDVRVIDIVDTKEIAVYKLTVCRRFFEQWLQSMMEIIRMKRADRVTEILDEIKSLGAEREVFMHLFEWSSALAEQMSEADCEHVFLGVLKGSGDITRERLLVLCDEYDVSLSEDLGVDV